MSQGLILETVGVEIEGGNLTRNQVFNGLMQKYGENYTMRNLIVSRDASVESRAVFVGRNGNNSQAILQHSDAGRNLRNGNSETLGFEIISQPLQINEMEEMLWKVLNFLSANGEIESPRAAFHIHVGFPYGLSAIKNALRCAKIFDPVLFRIAGFGKEYRGKINNSIYALPVENGPCVTNGQYWYKLLNINDALKVRTLSDFWKFYGISSNSSKPEVSRYSPGRYFATNLFSLLLRPTIEFRHFNSTLNPRYAIASVKLAQGIAEIAMKANRKLVSTYFTELSPFREYSIDRYFLLLSQLQSLQNKIGCDFPLTNDTLDTLYELLQVTPYHDIRRNNVATHLREYSFSRECARVLQRVDTPENSEFIDIHNIRDYRMVEGV